MLLVFSEAQSWTRLPGATLQDMGRMRSGIPALHSQGLLSLNCSISACPSPV